MNGFAKLCLCAATIMAVGCAAPPAPPPKVVAPDAAAARLEAALAQRAAEPAFSSSDSRAAKARYGKDATTVTYWGDASVLLKDAAQAMNMEFKVGGPHPRLPIYVQVAVKDVSLQAFLRDVAGQLGGRADVILSSTSIELRYRNHP